MIYIYYRYIYASTWDLVFWNSTVIAMPLPHGSFHTWYPTFIQNGTAGPKKKNCRILGEWTHPQGYTPDNPLINGSTHMVHSSSGILFGPSFNYIGRTQAVEAKELCLPCCFDVGDIQSNNQADLATINIHDNWICTNSKRTDSDQATN